MLLLYFFQQFYLIKEHEKYLLDLKYLKIIHFYEYFPVIFLGNFRRFPVNVRVSVFKGYDSALMS